MKINQQELKVYWSAYSDAWNLFKRVSENRNDDDFGESVDKECVDLVKKYGGSEFARRLFIDTTLMSMNEILKREDANGNNERQKGP